MPSNQLSPMMQNGNLLQAVQRKLDINTMLQVMKELGRTEAHD